MKLGGSDVPVLSYADALRRPAAVAPWQPALIALCLCVAIYALTRRRHTMLYAPVCVFLGLTLLLWLGLPAGGDTWANLVLAPWMTWTPLALAICGFASLGLWALWKKRSRLLALLSAALLIVSAVICRCVGAGLTYAQQSQISYLEAGAPTPYYRPWTSTDLVDYSDFRTVSTLALPVYADASTDTQMKHIPAGWSLDPQFISNFHPTIKRGWRALELEEETPCIGYVRTADLLRMIRTADCEDRALMRKLLLRTDLFAQDHNSWHAGKYLTPDIVYARLPWEAPVIVITLAVALLATLLDRKPRRHIFGSYLFIPQILYTYLL